MRVWSYVLTTICGLWTEIDERGELPKTPFIICPNHGSYLDIIIMYRVFSRYSIFMGKAEITTWPLFGIFFTKGMNIPVNRKCSKGAHEALQVAKAELAKGHNVIIFPEGTIPQTAPKMRAFKNGAFKLALEENIPIVPMTFVNNWRRLQAGAVLKQLGGAGPSRIVIHKPVYPKDYAELGVVRLKHDIFETIEEPLKRHHGDK